MPGRRDSARVGRKRGLDLPEVDEFFETNRAGVHVIGELGGMGLIKNAVRQGMQLGRRFKSILKPLAAGQVHATIVGAGPAGIAAALTMKEAGLEFVLVDQGPLSAERSPTTRGKSSS